MKKTLLFLGLLGSLVGLQAQQVKQTMSPANEGIKTPTHQILFDKSKLRRGTNPSRTQTQYWLNYGVSIDSFNSGNHSVLHQNYLFPDSLCYGTFGTGSSQTFSGIWVHHLGDVLDVTSYIFNIEDNVQWNRTTPFSVDSLAILYGYTRHDANTSVVDTLIISMFTGSATTSNSNMGTYYFTGETANYGSDTVCFKDLGYNHLTNTVVKSGDSTSAAGVISPIKIIKIPLTIADTAAFFLREKLIAVPGSLNVPAGGLVATDVQFKPGYSYALGDHIDTQHNAFLFASYEEKGASTFQTYYGCRMGSAACDYNVSSIVPSSVRYNYDNHGWDGSFIPSYAYTAPYSFEHHYISYKVTNPPLAVNELDNNNFSLGQNRPNPFTKETTINYEIKTASKNVALQIFDVTGVKVFEKTQTNVNPGKYSVDINNDNLSAGIYFYSLVVDGNKINKKMVVAK